MLDEALIGLSCTVDLEGVVFVVAGGDVGQVNRMQRLWAWQ